MSVIPFKRPEEKPNDPHLSGEAKCIGCGHEWVAVAPVGTITLECPSCGAMRRYPFCDYRDGEKIRKAIAEHSGDEIAKARIGAAQEEAA